MTAQVSHSKANHGRGLFRRTLDRLLGRSATIEAGGHGRRWSSTGLRSPARETLARRQITGARAASFVSNSPYGASVLSAWTSNLIGDGPAMRPKTDSDATKRDLQAGWSRWWDACDADGISDLGGFLQRVARSEFVFGEAFVHLRSDPETGALRLALLAPDQIDPSMTRDLGDGRKIVAGIEVDASGRRLAYHVRANHDVPLTISLTATRIPAEDVIHLYEPTFPGQMRGLSRLAPVATKLAEVDRLEDALLAKANTSALFGVILYSPNHDAGGGQALANEDFGLEPGAAAIAPPGYSVESVSPPETSDATGFLKSQIRAIAAGAGIPYQLISADLSDTNYSSARLGLLEFRRKIVALQKTLVVGRFLLPVWRRFLFQEALAGRLDMGPAITTEAEFIFPGWAQIDPLKETQADALAIERGIKSRFEVIGQRGRDPEAVDAEIGQDTHAGPANPTSVPTAAPQGESAE